MRASRALSVSLCLSGDDSTCASSFCCGGTWFIAQLDSRQGVRAAFLSFQVSKVLKINERLEKSEKWALKRIPVVFRVQHWALSCRVIFSINLSLLFAWEVLVAVSGSSWQCPMEDSPSVPVQEPPPAYRDTNPEHNGRGECIHARPCLRVHVCETASAVPHKNMTLLFFPSVVGPASLHHADSVWLSRRVQRVVFQGHRESCWEQICYWWKSVNSVISILFTAHFISREVKICVRVE